jgi:hypothetical protein
VETVLIVLPSLFLDPGMRAIMRLQRLGILWLLGSGPWSGMKGSGDAEHEPLLCPVAVQRKLPRKQSGNVGGSSSG